MFTDMVGFTSLGERDEALSMELLEEQRGVVRPLLAKHHGREVKTIGDAFLVEFPSSLEAINCAGEIQASLKKANNQRPKKKRILLRIGIHMGDVIHTGSDVAGDTVNVASRIQAFAPVGGVCVTEQVYDSVVAKVDYKFESLGVPELKNVTRPFEVYQISGLGQKSRQEPFQKGGELMERVAVLPFVNLSPDPNDEYFADGLTEELIGRLSQIRGLEVIARTSIMNYKRKEKNVSQIGRELHVGTIMEGSVRKAGNKIRVTAQLVNANTEGHLWASSYERNLEDIFAVQTEIAERVAGELKIKLLATVGRTVEKKPTENLEAYSDFLRGRELFREGTRASVSQAVRLFEKAIELDPSFARAHVGLAECHQRLAGIAYEPWDTSIASVKILLERALTLDPDLPEAHASLSNMFFDEDNFVGAETEARRALDLNPSLPEAYSSLSELAGIKGEREEMVKLIEAAYRLDPIRPQFIGAVGQKYFWTGREKEAVEYLRKTEQLAPSQTYWNMAEYHLSEGNVEKAEEFYAQYEKLRPNSPWVVYMGGIIAARTGDKEKALRAIRELENAKIGPMGLNYIAFVYHALGDLDSYFDCMNKALEAHTIAAGQMMYNPLFAKARADPRYQKLIQRFMRQMGVAT